MLFVCNIKSQFFVEFSVNHISYPLLFIVVSILSLFIHTIESFISRYRKQFLFYWQFSIQDFTPVVTGCQVATRPFNTPKCFFLAVPTFESYTLFATVPNPLIMICYTCHHHVSQFFTWIVVSRYLSRCPLSNQLESESQYLECYFPIPSDKPIWPPALRWTIHWSLKSNRRFQLFHS